MRLMSAAVLALAILIPGNSQAATLNAFMETYSPTFGPCGAKETSGGSTIELSCYRIGINRGDFAQITDQGYTYVRAEPGNLGVSIYASSSATAGLGLSSYVNASAFVSISDELTIGIQNGWFSIPLDALGEISLINLIEPFYGSVYGSLTVNSGKGSVTIFESSLAYQQIFNGEVVLTQATFGTTTGVTDLLLPIVEGTTWFNMILSAGGSCATWVNSESGRLCVASATFSNSVRFLGATVYDEFMNPVTGVSVTSATGFDYLVGVEPHQVSAVPLPLSGLLLGAALVGLGGVGVSRRCRCTRAVS